MRIFKTIDESLPFFKALASDVRIQILNVIAKEPGMNLNELASRIGITSGALTTHIRILEEVGIIEVKTIAANRHGVQKICTVITEKYLTQIGFDDPEQNFYNVELCPGHYVDYHVMPTCGLATAKQIVGVYDDPAYFADTERFNAQVLWFAKGFVEYDIPNFLPDGSVCKSLMIQAELGSETVAYNNDYTSDIYFSINEIPIGIWQSPGDFGGVKGLNNPEWWPPRMNQFGTLLELRIDNRGTFAEGKQISDITLEKLGIIPKTQVRLRLDVPEDTPTSRGLTIYGRGFGNYDSGIMASFNYE